MATITRDLVVLKDHRAYTGWYEKLIHSLQGWQFGIVAMSIAISGMVGGISLMYILKSHAPLWQLGVSVILVLAVNICAVLSTSVKWTVNLFVVSFIINMVLILINFSPLVY